MTRDLILHIGHYKTGTTALQVFMASNRGPMARRGLVYAQTGLKLAKHSELAFTLLREAGVQSLMHGFNGPRRARRVWTLLFQELRALPEGARLLVSTEEFMRLGAYPAAAAGLARILAEAPDIRLRVIAYLRPPGEHLRSWYNQLVKMGAETAGPDQAVLTRVEAVHWDYALALRPWIELAGPEGVILRGYDPQLRAEGALVADFLAALGAEGPPGLALPRRDPNPRLDARLLPLRRALARADLPKAEVDFWIDRARWILEDEGTPLPPEAFAPLRAQAAEGIAALAALPGAGFDAARLLADLPGPDPAQTPEAARMALLAAEVIRLDAEVTALRARLEALESRSGGTA